MRKIFYLFFIIFIYNFGYQEILAQNSVDIITREEWGAIEEYKYLDSQEWIEILKKENKSRIENETYISDKDTILSLGTPDYNESIEKYLSTFFSKELEIESVITQEKGRELFWPIAQAKHIQGIVIHHTAWDYTDSYQSVREIYKFHTLERKWGDIGYNFLISADGEIFEGRSGGEKAVGAHNKWNNVGNIGISLMGNYSEINIPQKQTEALNNLMSHLIEKYEIDINKKVYFHEQCKQSTCVKDIYSELNFPIIAHRDSSDTTCPGNQGYKDFLEIRKNLQKIYKIPEINKIKLEKIFDKYTQENLKKLGTKLVVLKHKENNFRKKQLLQLVIDMLDNYLLKKYI